MKRNFVSSIFFMGVTFLLLIAGCKPKITPPVDDGSKDTEYTITFDLQGRGDPILVKVQKDKWVEIPKTPNYPNVQFGGWFKDKACTLPFNVGTKITSSFTLYAKWNVYATYQITYILNGGKDEGLIKEYTTLAQADIVLIEPTRSDYYFRGFYQNADYSGERIQTIAVGTTGDLTLYAKWLPASLTNAYISIYGDSISTYEGYIPSDFPFYYPIYSTDVKDVSFTWWKLLLTTTKAKLAVNNSCSGSTVVGSTATAGESFARITRLKSSTYGNPNIIIIYLGINDVVNGATEAKFENSYHAMLDQIKLSYPQADIFLCTLPYETYTNTKYPGKREQFNTIIRKMAAMFQYPLIEFASVITEATEEPIKTYLGDNIHPNKAGMEVLAQKASAVVVDYYSSQKVPTSISKMPWKQVAVPVYFYIKKESFI